MTFTVSDLTVQYGETVVIRRLDFVVAPGEIVALLGASGSGKSSIVRALCGLQPATGAIAWNGNDLARLPTHRRGIGLMFQDQALFGHLDVAGNVAFGLKMHVLGAHERKIQVAQLLATVGLEGFEARAIATLSGGEQQRVALARALAPVPDVLLLDEPFGALDRTLRERLLIEVGELLRRNGVTTVIVTHDHDEAFSLADRVAVLHDGQIEQMATPTTLWQQPKSVAVCEQLGFVEAVDGEVQRTPGGSEVITPWGVLPHQSAMTNGPVRVVLRPDALAADEQGALQVDIQRVRPHANQFQATVQLGTGPRLMMPVPASTRPGDTLRCSVRPDAVLCYLVGTSLPPAFKPPASENDQ